MTRGRFVVITDDGVFTSCEFNGDMGYTQAYGKEVVKGLRKVKNLETFSNEIRKFNDRNFQMEDDGESNIFSCSSPIVFSKEDYYKKWFSDYLYIKNISNKPQKIVTRKPEDSFDRRLPPESFNDIVLSPKEIGIFTFGRYYGLVKANGKTTTLY